MVWPLARPTPGLGSNSRRAAALGARGLHELGDRKFLETGRYLQDASVSGKPKGAWLSAPKRFKTLRAHLTGDQSNFFVLPSNSLHAQQRIFSQFGLRFVSTFACVWGTQCCVSNAVGYTRQGARPVVECRNQPWKLVKGGMLAHAKPRLRRRGAAHGMTAAPEHVLYA